jgi:hypothetical protein
MNSDDILKDKSLFAPESEKIFLNALITDAEECFKVAGNIELKANDFSIPEHQSIFRICREARRSGDAIDAQYIAQRLVDYNIVKKMSDALPILGGITGFSGYSVTGLLTAPAHARIIKERSALRALWTTLYETVNYATQNSGEAIEVIDHAKNQIEFVQKMMSGQNKLPEIIKTEEFLSEQYPERSVIVEGLLHESTKLVLAGPSKSSKTWIVLDMALSVAAGKQWWGLNTKKTQTLFCNFEILPDMLQNRMKKLKEVRGISDSSLDIWNLRGHSAPMHIINKKIISRGKGYGLIILDPLYKLTGNANENDNTEMGRILDSMEEICSATGAAVVYCHHFSKGLASTKQATDRLSGAGVLIRDCDTALILSPHKEQDAYSVESITRNFRRPESFCVRWDYPIMTRDDSLDPHDLKVNTSGEKGEKDNAEMMKVLKVFTGVTGEWQRTANEELGVSKQRFYKILELLADAGHISKQGSFWVRTCR